MGNPATKVWPSERSYPLSEGRPRQKSYPGGNRVVASESSHLSYAEIYVFSLPCVGEYIDLAACFLDVGSSYPPGAEAGKGRAVRPLKGNVSWV
jgi:hypothetical protein